MMFMNGLGVTVVGIAVVFVGLGLLVIMIKLLTGFFAANKKSAPAPAAPAAPAPAPAPAPVAEPAVEEIALNDDSEIVAAIMAAITCMYEGTGKRPVVRAVRRSSKGWGNAYR